MVAQWLGGPLPWIAPASAALALASAGLAAWWVLRQEAGTAPMQQIAAFVREGATAYIRQQYRMVAVFFGLAFVALWGMAAAGWMSRMIPWAFLSGGVLSGLAGFFGLQVATLASSRTAHAAGQSLSRGLRVAFLAGSVMGLIVVGLALGCVCAWQALLAVWNSGLSEIERLQQSASVLLAAGMGASLQALFARVGGGIFTKAADVGADLVGKVEAGIPEDDARNPAVIADNVGDNVGDVAGMGADLFESYMNSNLATMALGVTAYASSGMAGSAVGLPLGLSALGILASIAGIACVRAREEVSQAALLSALRRGLIVASGIMLAASYGAIRLVMGPAYVGLWWAVAGGLVAGLLIGLITERYTSNQYRPTQRIAHAASTGPATVIIAGLSVGMASTVGPVLVIVGAVLFGFYMGGGHADFARGLYSIGLTSVGMLSTLGITLATDAYGPVADNAGGNAQMAGLPPVVRTRTDALDSLGNTTAATGKGFAIGSAALTALALVATFRDQALAQGLTVEPSLLHLPTMTGLFLGAMLPFGFCALTIDAVGKSAEAVVREVRRQFQEVPGLLQGTAKPDYARCVSLVTSAAQGQMVLPSLVAVAAPLAAAWLLGASGVLGLLMGAMVSGFLLAVMMANAGGAWDNAKKFIEEGHLGGKGSDPHKASVVGDTVGDPLKDTSGPSLNILIKLMSMVAIVLAVVVARHALLR